MGSVTKTKTWADNEGVNYDDMNSNFDTLYTLVNGNVDNDNIKASAGIAYSKLSLSNSIADSDIASTADIKLGTISYVIDGGGGVITTGVKGDLEIPFNCSIIAATSLADQSGSIVVDIWKDTYANFPPTDADSITSSTPPTISSATKAQDTSLSGWTTSISAGDILRFNVDSCTSVTRCLISLKYRKS